MNWRLFGCGAASSKGIRLFACRLGKGHAVCNDDVMQQSFCPKTFSLVLLLSLTSCATFSPVRRVRFHPDKLAEMEVAIRQTIASNKIPGGVLWLEHQRISYQKAFGQRALVPVQEPMTMDTIFDAASLTKVVATTPAVLLLVERGRLKLDVPAHRYLPEFKGDGKEAITIRQLLTHTSGLRPDIDTKPPWSGYDTAIQMACAEKLRTPPGAAFRYSDINFFLFGRYRAAGQRSAIARVCGARDFQAVANAGHRFSAAGRQVGPHRAHRENR